MAMWGYAILKGLQVGAETYQGIASANQLKEQAKGKERQAAELRYQHVYNTIRFNEETRRMLSLQRQLYGQAGVTLEGAPLDVLLRTKRERVVQRLEEARSVRGQVENLWLEADALRRAARDVRTSAYYSSLFGAGSDLMGSMGSFGGKK